MHIRSQTHLICKSHIQENQHAFKYPLPLSLPHKYLLPLLLPLLHSLPPTFPYLLPRSKPLQLQHLHLTHFKIHCNCNTTLHSTNGALFQRSPAHICNRSRCRSECEAQITYRRCAGDPGA